MAHLSCGHAEKLTGTGPGIHIGMGTIGTDPQALLISRELWCSLCWPGLLQWIFPTQGLNPGLLMSPALARCCRWAATLGPTVHHPYPCPATCRQTRAISSLSGAARQPTMTTPPSYTANTRQTCHAPLPYLPLLPENASGLTGEAGGWGVMDCYCLHSVLFEHKRHWILR